MTERKPLFAECGKCGERWKIATLPMGLGAAARALGRIQCPNCGERREVGMLPTVGVGACRRGRRGSYPPAIAAILRDAVRASEGAG